MAGRRGVSVRDLAGVPAGIAPEVRVGHQLDGTMSVVPMKRMLRHSMFTGKSGGGKSAAVLGLVTEILTRCPLAHVVLVDWKGETCEWVRDEFGPVVVAPVRPDITPRTIVTVKAFGDVLPPLDPLAPVPGMLPEVQAFAVATLIDTMAHGLGPRMRAILTPVLQSAIEARANLLDVRAALMSSDVRAALAARVRSQDLRRYLTETFDDEPAASIQALRARLDELLLLPTLRGMLCAGRCVSGADMLAAPLTLVDLSGAPPGLTSVARFVGQLILTKLVDAIFARPHGSASRPVLVIVDEWAELATPLADVFEAVLAQARSRQVAFWLVHQTAAQIEKASSSLLPILTANLALHVAFKPEERDLAHAARILPLSGRRIDAVRKDRLLSRDDERRLLLDELARLPVRHALWMDLLAGESGVLRSPTLPFERVRAEANRLPRSLRDAWRAGRYGISAATLAKSARPTISLTPAVVEEETAGARVEPAEASAPTRAASPSARGPRGKTRPRLVIP